MDDDDSNKKLGQGIGIGIGISVGVVFIGWMTHKSGFLGLLRSFIGSGSKLVIYSSVSNKFEGVM